MKWINPEIEAPPFNKRLLLKVEYRGMMQCGFHVTIGFLMEGCEKKWFEKEAKPPYIVLQEEAPYNKLPIDSLVLWMPLPD